MSPAPRRKPRTLGALAIGGVVLALLYLQVVDQARFAAHRIGVVLDTGSDDPLRIGEVAPGLPADRGGLETGDVIVEMAGHPVSTEADYDRAAVDLERGKPAPFRVRRGDAELTFSLVPGTAFPWKQLTVNALAALAHLFIAVLVLMQGGWDPRGRILFLFSFAVAVEFALPPGGSSVAVYIASQSAFLLLTGIQFPLEMHLGAWIPTPLPWLRERRWGLPALYAIGVGLGAAAAGAFLVESLGAGELPWSNEQADFLLFQVMMPLWAVALAGLLAWQARRNPEPEKRSQALLVLLGIAPWAVYILSTTALGWIREDWTEPGWLSLLVPLILLVYPVAVFVAIYRYHLFDLRVVVRRSMIYATITTALLLFFYALLGAGGAILSQWVDQEGHSVWVIALATLVLGLIFAPLRRWVQQLVDDHFFPERGAQRSRLIDLASELPALGQLPAMGRHLTQRLDTIFGVSSSTILLADAATGVLATLASSRDLATDLDYSFLLAPEDPGVQLLQQADRPLPARQLGERSPYLRTRLQLLEAETAVPVSHHDKLVGVLLLGGRTDGQELGGEELELLSLLGHHVANVFENARLFESATYESLTGLLRREKILEQLEREVLRAHRYTRPLTVGMADLDNFKELNDSFGHLAGDTVLKRIAQVLATELRSTDLVGRYGGEEFLLLLPETELQGGFAVAEKLRRAVETTAIPLDGGRMIQVTLSIGLSALGEGEVAESLSSRDLIESADRALYDAKHAGKNRVLPKIDDAGRPIQSVRSG